MIKKCITLLVLVSALLMTGCRHTLESESGLYNVKLERNIKVGADGCWLWGKGNPYAHQRVGRIYIAPMNVSLVKDVSPHLLQLMRQQMFSNMVTCIGTSLRDANRKNGTDWRVTDNLSEACVRVDTALVHFKPQRPGLRIFSSIASIFSPVPGVGTAAAMFAEGDICLECTVRDVRTGQLLLAFKDSNRKKTRLYKADAYSATGNADVNLREWSERLARVFRACAFDKLGNNTLRKRIEERSVIDTIRVHM